jgi:hypothetical protein
MHSGLAGARVDQVMGADANDYITKFENAHGSYIRGIRGLAFASALRVGLEAGWHCLSLSPARPPA